MGRRAHTAPPARLLLLLGVAATHAAKLTEPSVTSVPEERSAVRGDEPAPLSEVPASMRWTRAFTRECTSCLKECLGIRAQKAQANVMKFQAPFSLITWYLFQNRPFKMWPIENLFRALANVRAPSNPRRHHWKSP
eukprot:Transcript_18553.p2 GENE.Transcript_18553~~Transcript_18553.p2  ORF type:complete len:136 (-),score=37.35 Transcript_18553:261-668(-)